MEYQEIIKETIEEGTSNPWATSSTDIEKIIFECDSNNIDDVRNFIIKKYIVFLLNVIGFM